MADTPRTSHIRLVVSDGRLIDEASDSAPQIEDTAEYQRVPAEAKQLLGDAPKPEDGD